MQQVLVLGREGSTQRWADAAGARLREGRELTRAYWKLGTLQVSWPSPAWAESLCTRGARRLSSRMGALWSHLEEGWFLSRS